MGTFPPGRVGNLGRMQPDDSFEAQIPAQVGMTVVDAAGAQAGTVSAVQAPGTDVRPDVAAGVAERLMTTGYFLIDGTGALANDTYGSGDQIDAIADGTVTLRVTRDELYRTDS